MPAPAPAVLQVTGLAVEAQLRQPMAITDGARGAIYILDAGNQRIHKVGTDGVISTVARKVLPVIRAIVYLAAKRQSPQAPKRSGRNHHHGRRDG